MVEHVLTGSPSFLPPKEDNKDTARDILLGCEEVIWLRPPCIDDPGRNYNEDVRRRQLKMRILGTNWGIEDLRQLETTPTTPISAPLLTGAIDDPFVGGRRCYRGVGQIGEGTGARAGTFPDS